MSIHEALIEQISCDLITSTPTCYIFKIIADRVNVSSVPKTRENFTWKEKNCFQLNFKAVKLFVKVSVRIHGFTPSVYLDIFPSCFEDS